MTIMDERRVRRPDAAPPEPRAMAARTPMAVDAPLSRRRVVGLLAAGVVASLAGLHGQVPAASQAADASSSVTLKGTLAFGSEAGTPVEIQIARWSTDEDRTPIVAALAPPAPARAGGAPDAAAAGRGGRAGGARGGGRGDAPPDPIAALTAAIKRAPTVGFLWTDDITGYSIKLARRVAVPDEGERIVLVTDRRLGTNWLGVQVPPGQTATDYEFTVIELRVPPQGAGEGRSSLTTKIAADNDAKTLVLDTYAAAPVLLRNVSR